MKDISKMEPLEAANVLADQLNEGAIDAVEYMGYWIRPKFWAGRVWFGLFDQEDERLGEYKTIYDAVKSARGRIKRRIKFKPFTAVLFRHSNANVVNVNSVSGDGKKLNYTIPKRKENYEIYGDWVWVKESGTFFIEPTEDVLNLMADIIKKRSAINNLKDEIKTIGDKIKTMPQSEAYIQTLRMLDNDDE